MDFGILLIYFTFILLILLIICIIILAILHYPCCGYVDITSKYNINYHYNCSNRLPIIPNNISNQIDHYVVIEN